ncbi:MAG: DNA polymerase IV, partial [Actinomycetota bacterium]|nr:DNA polymerase IV [Actinomycetota bacterium]
SASYEARMRGVRSAMPSMQARQLCPDAVFISANFSDYGEASSAVHEVFRSITPLIEPIALDEAFLDVAGAHRLFGSSEQIAWRIRHDVAELAGLDCSVGVASSKLFAKLASVAAKPVATPTEIRPGLGVKVVERSDEIAFLHGHPVRALWGVGAATLARLAGLGVSTVGDLAKVPVEGLVAALGTSHGTHLADLARGIDRRPVEPDRAVKSISHEETFERDVVDPEILRSEITRLADAVAARLRRAGLEGRTVQLKIRHPDLRLSTRSVTVDGGLTTGPAIARHTVTLLDRLDLTDGVRLLGVGVSGLSEPGPQQLSLVMDAEEPAAMDDSWRDLSDAMDEIRGRFGSDAIGPGPRAAQRGRPGERRWGP